MKRLSTLTRKENCFYTIDGQTVCTIQELHDYLMNCSPQTYTHHANEKKNDFAQWIHDVLLFPEFSKKLFGAKNIDEARTHLKEFTQTFDYRSKNIPDEKSFVTIDEYRLKNIQELYYYLLNCDDRNYNYHVNAQKNDFSKWIGDVWQLPTLSQRVASSNDRMAMINVIKDFLINGESNDGAEYVKYLGERIIHEAKAESAPTAPLIEPSIAPAASADGAVNAAANAANAAQAESAPIKAESANAEQVKPQAPANETKTAPDTPPNTPQSDAKDAEGGEKININPHILDRPEEIEVEKNTGPTLDGNKFHSFSDEELEKFSKFSKKEKEIEEPNIRIEYLKTAQQELTGMIRELRRQEKDALVADLLLRSIAPKIDYYALTKNIDDYNHIIRIMKDVQHEIEEASVMQQTNLAEEIFKELRLQGLAMKKA